MNTSNMISAKNYPKVDMAPIYQVLMQKNNKGEFLPSAHVNVFPDLPFGKKILHVKTSYGYDHIVLKSDDPLKMLARVWAEVEKIGNKNLPTFDFPIHPIDATTGKELTVSSSIGNHTILDGLDIGNLQALVLAVSYQLHINCPQILLIPGYHSAGSLETDNNNDVLFITLNPSCDLFFFASHELRHAWQKKYHPEMFDNYMSLSYCKEKYGAGYSDIYGSQIAEFDADVFACAFLKLSLSMSGFFSQMQTPLNNAKIKAANLLLSPHNGKHDFDRVIDYKAIYPDLIT